MTLALSSTQKLLFLRWPKWPKHRSINPNQSKRHITSVRKDTSPLSLYEILLRDCSGPRRQKAACMFECMLSNSTEKLDVELRVETFWKEIMTRVRYTRLEQLARPVL
ncbi:hypothetical protein EAF00_010657 [Botryotinia globosa]|nr:hypothetical protein EAF00_010657 [Botryotinia globosa]